MGEVILVFRILPDGIESIPKVRLALEKLKPERLEEEPIAFGLIAFKFTKIIPDAGGYMEKLENQLESIKGVNAVENTIASRAL